MASLFIGISKASGDTKYELYESWLKQVDSSIECIDLSGIQPDEAVQALSRCSALVLSGGTDIDPELYERPDERERCRNIDRGRDKLELALIQRARLIDIPMVAVCRGMQLLNVFLGGTLIVDVPSDKPDALNHQQEEGDAMHPVTIVPQSLLHRSAGVLEETINSAHHQAIDKLSWYLKATAQAPDGIIEAFEWSDQAEKAFLLAVQWHPERLPFKNPLSGKLAQAFVEAARGYVPHHRID